jgi:tripartite-type tricarboxylate transporter receptor subunit TctC
MRLTRRASILATLATPALAQTYPERAIRLIIPYSAGGVADTIARTIQPKMAEHLGQSLVVENRTGASGAIAAAALAQSAPDGHSFMLEGATFATLPLVSRSLPVGLLVGLFMGFYMKPKMEEMRRARAAAAE